MYLGAAAIALAATVLFAGSSPAQPMLDVRQKNGGVLRIIVVPGEPGTDPALDGDQPAEVWRAVCANLFNWPDRNAPPSGLRLVPEIAAPNWHMANNGKRFIFPIRNTYRFSNGRRVTPNDVQFSINRVLRLQAPAPPIVGAAALSHGRGKKASGIRVQGNKLIIDLTRRDNALPAQLAVPTFCILPSTTPVVPSSRLLKPITAGPYYVKEHVVDHRVKLLPNRYYHGPRPHHASSILVGAASNYVGFPDAIPVDTAFAKAHPHQVRTFVQPRVGRLELNTTRGPFKSVALRRAVNFATDRPAVAAALLPSRGTVGAGIPTDQILPPGMPGYRPFRIYPLNGPNYGRAESILHRARKKCGRVTLIAGSDPFWQSGAQEVAKDWRKIGCRVDIKYYLGESMYEAANDPKNFDAAFNPGWTADYIDAADFIDQAADGQPWTFLNDAHVNREIHRADRMTGSNRFRAFGKLDRQITKSYAPWVSLYYTAEHWFFPHQIRGIVFQPYTWRGVLDLAALWPNRLH